MDRTEELKREITRLGKVKSVKRYHELKRELSKEIELHKVKCKHEHIKQTPGICYPIADNGLKEFGSSPMRKCLDCGMVDYAHESGGDEYSYGSWGFDKLTNYVGAENLFTYDMSRHVNNRNKG